VLSVRDDYPSTADIFGIFLDTYNDHQNGFYFGNNPEMTEEEINRIKNILNKKNG